MVVNSSGHLFLSRINKSKVMILPTLGLVVTQSQKEFSSSSKEKDSITIGPGISWKAKGELEKIAYWKLKNHPQPKEDPLPQFLSYLRLQRALN